MQKGKLNGTNSLSKSRRVPLSLTMRILRPLRKVTRVHKQVDTALQVIAIPSDVLNLVVHHTAVATYSHATSDLQNCFGYISKIILVVKISRMIGTHIMRANKKNKDSQDFNMITIVAIGVTCMFVYDTQHTPPVSCPTPEENIVTY